MSPVIRPHRRPLQRSFHVLVKPIGSLCNMECAYCYYLHKKDLLHETPDVISDDLLPRRAASNPPPVTLSSRHSIRMRSAASTC